MNASTMSERKHICSMHVKPVTVNGTTKNMIGTIDIAQKNEIATVNNTHTHTHHYETKRNFRRSSHASRIQIQNESAFHSVTYKNPSAARISCVGVELAVSDLDVMLLWKRGRRGIVSIKLCSNLELLIIRAIIKTKCKI